MAKPTMQILAEKVEEASGLEWGIAHRSLRSYVHNLTNEQFQEEVKRVDTKAVFSILWSVGLSGVRQDMCYKRIEELRL